MNSLKIRGERTNAPTTADGRTGSAGLTSIIILCYNQVNYTTACVQSILRHTPEPVELIFVDNGSTDGTRSYLDSLVSRTGDAAFHSPASITGIKIVRNDRNLGFAGGVNQGIREASGDFILLLNNDVIVTPGWQNEVA